MDVKFFTSKKPKLLTNVNMQGRKSIKTKKDMKKNIGSKLALYPTPVVVIGAEVEGKVTWTLVAHDRLTKHFLTECFHFNLP